MLMRLRHRSGHTAAAASRSDLVSSRLDFEYFSTFAGHPGSVAASGLAPVTGDLGTPCLSRCLRPKRFFAGGVIARGAWGVVSPRDVTLAASELVTHGGRMRFRMPETRHPPTRIKKELDGLA